MTRSVGGARGALRALAALLGALLATALLASPAAAHPLGNFTSNTSAVLTLDGGGVTVDYVVDLAEIPTVRLVQRLDEDSDGAVSEDEGSDYRASECATLAEGLTLGIDGAAVPADVEDAVLAFPEGQGGLVTSRLECTLRATSDLAGGEHEVTFADANLEGRIGWREVVATGDGVTLTASDVPAESTSDRLRSYPPDQLQSPLRVTEATLAVDGSGAVAPAPARDAAGPPDTPSSGGGGIAGRLEQITSSFTELVSEQEMTPGFVLLAVALALLLGAVHALAPGHGKTVMAAYLVSREGTGRQALALAGTVAVTHTLGVLLLGALFATTEAVAPEQLYAGLGVASGLLFVGVGLSLLRGALRRGGGDHDHGPGGHSHVHLPGDRGHVHEPPAAAGEGGTATALATATEVAAPHDHDHVQHDAPASGGLHWRTLVLPGLAGGLVPTPSALIVLLGGIAVGRAWFGVLLVSLYGIGMAAVLVGAGILLLRAKDRAAARLEGSGRAAKLFRVMPVLTASLVVVFGLVVVVRSALAL